MNVTAVPAATGSPAWIGPLTDLVQALSEQRYALEHQQLEAIDALTERVEAAYGVLGAARGDLSELRARLEQADPDDRTRAIDLLERARADNQVCGALITVAMQRLAVLRAVRVAEDTAGTYAPGGVALPPGHRLSRRA
jgi:hypothetical protein